MTIYIPEIIRAKGNHASSALRMTNASAARYVRAHVGVTSLVRYRDFLGKIRWAKNKRKKLARAHELKADPAL